MKKTDAKKKAAAKKTKNASKYLGGLSGRAGKALSGRQAYLDRMINGSK